MRISQIKEKARSDFDLTNIKKWSEVDIDDLGNLCRIVYMGSLSDLQPSGKIYTPQTTYQTARDIVEDALYWGEVTSILNGQEWHIITGWGDKFYNVHLKKLIK